MAVRDEMGVQLDAAHPGHADIRNDARCVVQASRFQKLRGRRKRIGGIPERPYEPAGRSANECVVIDDRNGGRFGHRTNPVRACRSVHVPAQRLSGQDRPNSLTIIHAEGCRHRFQAPPPLSAEWGNGLRNLTTDIRISVNPPPPRPRAGSYPRIRGRRG
jgi:hypothetical protein